MIFVISLSADFNIWSNSFLAYFETHSTRWCIDVRSKYLTRYLAEKILRMQCAVWPTCESKQAKNMWQLDPPARINRRKCDVRQEQGGSGVKKDFRIPNWHGWLFLRKQPNCMFWEWVRNNQRQSHDVKFYWPLGQKLEGTFECSTAWKILLA